MTIDTSRRAVLKGAPAIAIAAALPTPAIAATPYRAAWEAAFRKYEAAEAEDHAFNIKFRAFHDRWRAAVDAVPHVVLRPDKYTGNSRPVTTADHHYVNRARRLVQDVDAGKCRFDPIESLHDHLALCRDVVAADDQRNAEIEKISNAMGYDEAEARSEALYDAVDAARWTLMEMPAPDLKALHWKLDYILADDGTESTSGWQSSLIEPIRADMRRLLAGEA